VANKRKPGFRSRSHFDERADIGPTTNWFWDPMYCQHVARYLVARSWLVGEQIVDLGCGTGHGTAILARDRRVRVIGIDAAQDAIDAAPLLWTSPNLAFHRGDALNIPLPDESADTVVSLETIEHVADPARFLDEVARILRPGGRLVLSTPDREHYSPSAALGESHNPFHVSEMTRAEVSSLVATRFRIVASYGQEPTGSDGAAGNRRLERLARVVKAVTNPVLGRGPVAELVVRRVRRRHYPQLGDGQYLYVMLVCDRLPNPMREVAARLRIAAAELSTAVARESRGLPT
jgi:SAM-dependent methyltransferase